MYPIPGLEACMLNGKSEYYCIKGELAGNVVLMQSSVGASEMVKWKTGLSCRSLF
jgi:hypothetical protein